MKKDLVQLIKENPNARFIVDNDGWWMMPPLPKPDNEMTNQDWDDYNELELLASDGNIKHLGNGGYGSGHSYGGDILQALAIIVGVKVESV